MGWREGFREESLYWLFLLALSTVSLGTAVNREPGWVCFSSLFVSLRWEKCSFERQAIEGLKSVKRNVSIDWEGQERQG